MCSAVAVGDTRTLQQDVSFGLRQIVDVSLRALSPGINDPTTAQDAIFHATAVLAETLQRDAPPSRRHDDAGRVLVLTEQPSHQDLVRMTFDEVRRSAVHQPSVCVYLLESLNVLCEVLRGAGLDHRLEPLEEQARLVIAGAIAGNLLPADQRVVEAAYERRFECSSTLDHHRLVAGGFASDPTPSGV